jgi:hypothetical protein
MAESLYKYLVVAGVINSEATGTIITSTETEPVILDTLLVYESTAARNDDAIVRAYVEREKIAELPVGAFLDWATVPAYIQAAGRIPLDRELPVGQSLIVGQVSGAVASDMTFGLVYHLK